MMTNKTETQAERRAYLAEHMSVECHSGGTGPGMTKPDGSYVDVCPHCHGSGRRYLLRVKCDTIEE